MRCSRAYARVSGVSPLRGSVFRRAFPGLTPGANICRPSGTRLVQVDNGEALVSSVGFATVQVNSREALALSGALRS